MARPPIVIDLNELSALMRLMPTAKDCAAFFKCSVDTIERRIRDATTTKENPDGLSFAEFREQNMVHTRMTLVRKALKEAEKGNNTMLIFCLKNLCGWRDKQEGESDVTVNLNNIQTTKQKLSDEELDSLIEEKMARMVTVRDVGSNES